MGISGTGKSLVLLVFIFEHFFALVVLSLFSTPRLTSQKRPQIFQLPPNAHLAGSRFWYHFLEFISSEKGNFCPFKDYIKAEYIPGMKSDLRELRTF